MEVKHWQKQLIRFGLVGVASTLIFVAVAFFLLNVLDTSLIIANIGGFFVAFFFSYFGHAFWSFETKSDVRSLLKFSVLNGVNLMLIILISEVVVAAGLPSYSGILLVAVVMPGVLFLIQKAWVFVR